PRSTLFPYTTLFRSGQVQAVADELFELDFGRALGTAAIESAAFPAVSAVGAISPVAARTLAAGTLAARSGPLGGPLRAATLPRRTVFLPLLLLLCHLLNLCHQSGPFQGHQARG